MKPIIRDNVLINYHDVGTGPVTLLFVHGAYIDQTWWNGAVECFQEKFRVVTFDLPAHGKSGKDRLTWSLDEYAMDLHAVIETLDLRQIILIGHSMAGDINLIEAVAHPERIIGFIAIDTFKNAGTPLPGELQQQVAAIEQGLMTDFANTNEQYARRALFTSNTSAEIQDRIVEAYRNAYAPMAQAITPEIFRIDQMERGLLPLLPFKLILINVEYIPTNENALQSHTMQGYELLRLPGTCHYPMLENPDRLNEMLEEAIQIHILENQFESKGLLNEDYPVKNQY